MIFSGIGFFIALSFQNKIKGFSFAIFIWLFLAVIYDGIFLLLMAVFSDYPLETFALAASMFCRVNVNGLPSCPLAANRCCLCLSSSCLVQRLFVASQNQYLRRSHLPRRFSGTSCRRTFQPITEPFRSQSGASRITPAWAAHESSWDVSIRNNDSGFFQIP